MYRQAVWKSTAIFLLIVLCIDLTRSQYRDRDRFRGGQIRVPVVLRGDQPPPPDTELDIESSEEIHPLTDFSTWPFKHRGYTPIKLHPCEQSSCYPATGNLLIGREDQLYASSTCGLQEPQRYCIVSHLEERKKCFWCDSRPTKHPKPALNHNISNIIYRTYPGTRQVSWWQSENGKENVYIQLNLEAEFHFTHLIMTFKTFRPAAMLIERSYDFKKTWQVYRYFAHNCRESFPRVYHGPPENLTDVICESRYSAVSPSTDGEVIYRVLMQNVRIDNPYSQQVQNLLKITNLRINFTKLHTLGDDLLDRREEIQEKYYYAITDMVVRGSCSCYGHANRCLPLPGIDPKPDMVHGRCECTHNTKGRNCEKCEDFFNDLPWSPAVGKQSNACKRCNCNNHATSCHFDSAVYEASGRVSGGVCDGCKHNTMGTNCEQCKPFYYTDPHRSKQDPEVCRPCDCDPDGSLDGGICDSITDKANNLIAGSCHCKTNVEGRRCDICKNGFWNFSANNNDGCEQCTCNILGTIDNQGCDVLTGECTCKRYVTGRDCKQCLPEYWGLSEIRDGCQLCECDPGGSYDNNCDVVNGQCKCREHMTGRNCNIPKQQHFTASLDFLLYEAELARGSPTCQVVIREPFRDGRKDTWTGTGFMKSYEGSYIEFTVSDIKTTAEYDPVIRYELMPSQSWDEVILTVIRPEPLDPLGPCGNARTEDDTKRLSLPANSKSIIASPPICLEAGKSYKIRLEFNRTQYDRDTPSASVLIDSIVLIPRIESIPWMHGSPPAEARRHEFERHHCSLAMNSVNAGPVPDVCKKYYNSIGAYIFKGALLCHCDPTGSVSKLCDEYGGTCTCKPNVVGRRCERCAPGTYGFGPEGCKACDCNSIGALDNFCNVTTGQCKCRANTYGRECDQCRTGFWNFPNCQRCDCNGHADTCDPKTGACINCRDSTEGHTCDHCIEGYYGDPRLSVDIPCRQCPCPGTPGSNHSYAERCTLDPYTRDVICECQEGYSGTRCDVCADNYYGNPETPGGLCKPCECNKKIDLLKPGNCDPHTGKCKQCLNYTTGDHCEVCQAGYFRTYEEETCKECVCHILGTNSSAGPCDPYSGECICYPNVIGKECDRCAPNHWKIASGKGCEPCSCDPVGSEDLQCNEYDGQCKCKANFGGRQCSECRAHYWGNPKADECFKCDCNIEGSETLQCDRKTGACKCRRGIGGHNCDVCDRGYLGKAPTCSPCGECFDSWDSILQEHENYTSIEINRAKDIKKVGATGAYTKEFDDIQDVLEEIETLLNKTATVDLNTIDANLDSLRKDINKTETDLKDLDEKLVNAEKGNKIAEVKLSNLNNEISKLRNKTKELDNNGTNLQEGNVQGALDIIRNAKNKAEDATQKAKQTQDEVNYVERQRKATENLINVTKKEFEEKRDNDQKALQEIEEDLKNLTNSLPELNELICDGTGDPCDICGGAGCGNCGGSVSCEDGAKQQAETANRLAMQTESILKEKEDKAHEFMKAISLINSTSSKTLAQEAFDKALLAFNKANMTWDEVNTVKTKIDEFLQQNTSTPEDIKIVMDKILKKDIKLTPEEIKNLAHEIKATVDLLTNTEKIIEQTKEDLEMAKQLKKDAENARKEAEEIKDTADAVQDALLKSSVIQKAADEAIKAVNSNFTDMKKQLDKIWNETDNAHQQINLTSSLLENLTDEIDKLQKILLNNNDFARKLKAESENIYREANNTHNNLDTLEKQYATTQLKLSKTLETVENSKEKANDLVNRAVKLTATVTKLQDDIVKLSNLPTENRIDLLEQEIDELINRMHNYTVFIEQRAEHYKTCT